MKFENDGVYNFENAIRGMRLPMNSGDKSDTKYQYAYGVCHTVKLGENDLGLMQKLIKAGSPHDKFMRQIFVSVDITAPLYWWKEMDQYKVATTTNSQSTMHKLATTSITKECFEMDDFERVKVFDKEPYNPDDYTDEIWESVIDVCETLRKRYIETKNKKYWKELIRILPESWLQTRTWTADYKVLHDIVHQRAGHKLSEWQSFIDWVDTLPYADELIFYKGEN